MSNALAKLGFMIPFESYTQVQDYAKFIAHSEMVPTCFRGKPADIMIAWQYGYEIGLSPMQSLKNICVINGRATLWGDALLALVVVRKDFEDFSEVITGEGALRVATCTVWRRDREPVVRTFSWAEAIRAKLLEKKNSIWLSYPNRMLQMRARAFAIRDAFPDALMGLDMAEEVLDYNDTTVRVPLVKDSEVLATEVGAEEALVATLETMIEDATTIQELDIIAPSCKNVKVAENITRLRVAYKARREELRSPQNTPSAPSSIPSDESPED